MKARRRPAPNLYVYMPFTRGRMDACVHTRYCAVEGRRQHERMLKTNTRKCKHLNSQVAGSVSVVVGASCNMMGLALIWDVALSVFSSGKPALRGGQVTKLS